MVAFIWTVPFRWGFITGQLGTNDAVQGPSTQHCEQSEAIHDPHALTHGLLRFARNDELRDSIQPNPTTL